MTTSHCYSCQHRRTVAGSAHSRCAHPSFGSGDVMSPLAMIAAMEMMQTGRYRAFAITGSAHGITNGWFSWPLDYDPVWMVGRCLEFLPVPTMNTYSQSTSEVPA